MPDRIIKADLFKSDRWLDLHSTDARLLFVFLITEADDYGNVEAGNRRIFREARNFIDVKSENDIAKHLMDMVDADLLRPYESCNKTYYHIPRFTNSRRYWARKCPQSPYETNPRPETKQEVTKNPAADLPQTCVKPDATLLRGVGVGVGVKKDIVSSSEDDAAPPEDLSLGFAEWWKAWPATARKTAKASALEHWKRNRLGRVKGQLMAHLEAMKRTEQWLTGFEPAPMTYLRQKRWADDVPIAQQQPSQIRAYV